MTTYKERTDAPARRLTLAEILEIFAAGQVPLKFTAYDGSTAGPDDAEVEFFEKKVRPLLVERCYGCHSQAKGKANDIAGARAAWAPLAPMVPLLFAEANPMPIKYLLWRQGLIASPECRLPLTRISDGLAKRLDVFFAERQAA